MCKKYIFLLVIALCFALKIQAQMQTDTILESVLDLSIEELMNTKVSIATKTDKKLSETPSVVTVVSEEMIKNSGARNIIDILQYIPGFEFSKPRTGFVTIGIRGVKDPLTNSRFLILMDGVPYNGIMYGSGIALYRLLDINSIERIEVIRGPGSALYGRNAFIGVINIITKNGKKKNEVNLSSSMGNFNTLDFGGSYSTKVENFNAFFSVEKLKSDVTDSEFDNGTGGKSIWNLGVDNLYLTTKVGFNHFELSGMYSGIVNQASTGPYITSSDKETKIGIYSLQYKQAITSKTAIYAKLYGRNEFQVQHIEIYKPGITEEIAPGVPVSAVFPNGAYATPSFEAYTYGADINFNNIWLNKHHTLIGIQTDFYGIKNVELMSSYDTYTGAPLTYLENGETLFRGKETQIIEDRGWIEGNGHDYYNIAFYLQNIYYPVNNLSFTIGGRYDIDSEFGSVFNPRLSMVWNTEKGLIVKLLYGQAFRAPNSQEQFRKTGFTIGNNNLKPEKIKTSELSIRYALNKNMDMHLILFYNQIDNMIYAQGITSGTPGSPYSNIGKNTSAGGEFEYKMMINKQFYAYLNYSYTASENHVEKNDTTESFLQPDIAPHKFNIGFNYRFLKYFNFNTNLIYRSERERYFAISKASGNYILAPDGNKTFVSQDNIGNYFILNAKLRVFDFIKSMEISAEVYNILNTTYFDQDTEYQHQPAREGTQFIFTLKYNFCI